MTGSPPKSYQKEDLLPAKLTPFCMIQLHNLSQSCSNLNVAQTPLSLGGGPGVRIKRLHKKTFSIKLS
jgi:hypothetical protein